MKREVIIVLAALFSFLGNSGYSSAQTAEEFEREGLSHFQKAYYEAIPRGDKTQAEVEYGLAEKAFQEAIRRQPDRVNAYVHLGRTYFVQKKFDKAAEVYRTALELDPCNKAVYLRLASALEMSGDYVGAINILKRLREQETDERSLQVLDELVRKLREKLN